VVLQAAITVGALHLTYNLTSQQRCVDDEPTWCSRDNEALSSSKTDRAVFLPEQ